MPGAKGREPFCRFLQNSTFDFDDEFFRAKNDKISNLFWDSFFDDKVFEIFRQKTFKKNYTIEDIMKHNFEVTYDESKFIEPKPKQNLYEKNKMSADNGPFRRNY